MTSLAIPLTFEQADRTWLEAALNEKHPGTRVAAMSLSDTIGYKPTKRRVTIDYAPGGNPAGLPATMFLKGGFPGEGNHGSGLDFGMQLEVLTYRDAADRFGINTPRRHYLGYNEEAGQGILLLEDLAARDVRFLNVYTPMSLAEATAFVDAQAAFHARSWNSPDFAPGGDLGPGSPVANVRKKLFAHYFDRLTIDDQFSVDHLKLPRGAALPRALRDVERLHRAMGKLKAITKLQPHCYIHGDEHLGNFYIEPDGTPGFIDYAGRPDAWNLGFTYFLLHALDALDRRQWERPLLARYLDQLRRHGVDAPTFEDAWLVYRATSIFLLVLWINNSPRWQPEAINTANCARAALAVLDHDAFALLGC